jgi:hypothetical protein
MSTREQQLNRELIGARTAHICSLLWALQFCQTEEQRTDARWAIFQICKKSPQAAFRALLEQSKAAYALEADVAGILAGPDLASMPPASERIQ